MPWWCETYWQIFFVVKVEVAVVAYETCLNTNKQWNLLILKEQELADPWRNSYICEPIANLCKTKTETMNAISDYVAQIEAKWNMKIYIEIKLRKAEMINWSVIEKTRALIAEFLAKQYKQLPVFWIDVLPGA